MDDRRTALDVTQSSSQRRISFSRLKSSDNSETEPIIAWEHAYPKKGERYAVHLGDGRVLRTSPVVCIHEYPQLLEIETVNSTYRIDYLD